jgi:hypothetical protein
LIFGRIIILDLIDKLPIKILLNMQLCVLITTILQEYQKISDFKRSENIAFETLDHDGLRTDYESFKKYYNFFNKKTLKYNIKKDIDKDGFMDVKKSGNDFNDTNNKYIPEYLKIEDGQLAKIVILEIKAGGGKIAKLYKMKIYSSLIQPLYYFNLGNILRSTIFYAKWITSPIALSDTDPWSQIGVFFS